MFENEMKIYLSFCELKNLNKNDPNSLQIFLELEACNE